MSTLSDCFTASGTRITVAEALNQFSKELSAVTGAVSVALRAANGHILAEDLIAPRSIPPHNNAAVDGYAVFYEDLNENQETRLTVAGRIAAGHPFERDVKRGEAVQIFTGAPMPEGPDTVFMSEDCWRDGDAVILPAGIRRGENLRLAGEDIRAGDSALQSGSRLRAQDVAMAASLGFAKVSVRVPLRVTIFSTGDEIRNPGETVDKGSIFDVNRFSIMSLLDGLRCEVYDLGILADDYETVYAALANCPGKTDLVLTSGGVSMGEEDYIKAAVAALGGINIWNLAIKPGRPIALGYLGGGKNETPFIGLPGNPVAAMITFLRIARPIILLLAGANAVEPHIFRVPAAFDFKKKAGRREWLRVRLERRSDGTLAASKFPAQGSGILTSMVDADGLVELSEDQERVEIGELVDFLPFSEVLA